MQSNYLGNRDAPSELSLSLRQQRPALMMAAGFSMLVNLLGIAVPLYMLQLYDRVLSAHSEETLLMLSLITVAALVVMGLLDHIRSRILNNVSLSMDSKLGPGVLSALLKVATRNNRINDAQALRDLDTVRAFIGGSGLLALFDTPWVPLYLALIFILHPGLGWIALGGALALFALASLGEHLTRKAGRKASYEARQGQRFADLGVRNAGTAIAMGMAPALLQQWRKQADRGLLTEVEMIRQSAWISATSRALRQALQVAALGMGAWLVMAESITPGVMIAASILLSKGLAPVEASIAQWQGFVTARDAWQRLNDLFLSSPRAGKRMELPRPKGQLTLERVVYSVVDQDKVTTPIIKGVSLRLAEGESLALIGPSGSGKTTLGRLIAGVVGASAGRVLLDGVDLDKCDKDQFGRHIGYLPQDIELFDGSIKDNIARLDKHALAPDIVKAAQLAGVHELVLSLPNGYDTRIGAGGMSLSAGQRQRIGLARALFGSPRLVVLDEPNANLDSEGEASLIQTLAQLKQRKMTSIIIAHRKGILGGVDRILALHQGRVEIFGNPGQVMAHLSRSADTRPHSIRPSQVKTA